MAPRGLGYSPNFHDQPESSLCNTSVGVNSLIHDEPGHFRRWLELRDHTVSDMDCVPRALFGQYLADVADYMIARLNISKEEAHRLSGKMIPTLARWTGRAS